MSKIIEVKNLSFSYDSGAKDSKYAVQDVSFSRDVTDAIAQYPLSCFPARRTIRIANEHTVLLDYCCFL